MLLIAGVAGTSWGLVVAHRENAETTRALARADATLAFVTRALQLGDPDRPGGSQSTTIMESMDAAARGLDAGAFKDDPETRASLAHTIGEVYLSNGRCADGERLLRESLATRSALHPLGNADLVETLRSLCSALRARSSFEESAAAGAQSLEMAERLFGPRDPRLATVIPAYASTLRNQGRNEYAETILRRGIDLAEPHSDSLCKCMNSLGLVLIGEARTAEADTLFQRALELNRDLHPGDHSLTAAILGNGAMVRRNQGRFDEAISFAQAAVEMYKRIYRNDHSDTAQALTILAAILNLDLAQPDKALPLFEESLGMLRHSNSDDTRLIAETTYGLAMTYLKQERFADAEPVFQQALSADRHIYKTDHRDLAIDYNSLALCQAEIGRLDDAARNAQAAIDMLERIFPDGDPYFARSLSTLALVREKQARAGEADELIRRAEFMVFKFEPADGANARMIAEVKSRILQGRATPGP